MIIVRIIGGLGNQMLQYAMGRNIALKNNVELKLDISAFGTYTLHPYVLNNFNIIENIATDNEIKEFTQWKFEIRDEFKKIYHVFDKTLNAIHPYYKRKYIKEQGFTFDPNILKVKDNAYLEGYWTSEKYFKEIEPVIRKEFIIKGEPDSSNAHLTSEILDTESISIHIRRGDYITDPVTNKIFSTGSMDYYTKAVEDICKHTSAPHFFIFSNDLEWVKNNFSIPYPMHLVTINGPDTPHWDLHLMSLCKHHITANSTFSWWGAWLSTNKDKRIYTPKRWYKVDYIDQKDFFPDSWIKI
jgi:hypothetical protein